MRILATLGGGVVVVVIGGAVAGTMFLARHAASEKSPTVSASGQSANEVTAKLADSRLSSLRLTGGGTGWLVMSGAVLTTRDSGTTWADRTPPAALANGRMIFAAAPVSPDAVMVAASSSEAVSVTTTHWTSDGGKTWRDSVAPVEGYAVALALSPSGRAWLLTSRGAASNHQLSTLWVSGDRGARWEEVANSSGSFGDASKTGMTFADDSTGWMTNSDGDLYRTTNGGHLWSKQALQPASPQYRAQAAYPPLISGPAAVFARSGQISVSGGDRQYGSLFFGSDDGGGTWELRSTAGQQQSRETIGMVNRDVWFASGGDVVLISPDGGRTWKRSATVEIGSSVTAISFADASHGLVVAYGNGKASLLSTSDGGGTWRRLS